MTITLQKSKTIKGISLLVAFIFTLTSVTMGPSDASAALASLDIFSNQKEKSKIISDLYSIPQEIGSVKRVWNSGVTDKKSPLFIHIQDAHSNPEAQKNIYRILKFLENKYPNLSIGVEGLKGPLHPEYFDFFPKYPAANEAVIQDLLRKGELSGAELFMWNKYQKNRPQTGIEKPWTVDGGVRIRVGGAEDTELYRDNLNAYKELLSRRDEIETNLNPIRSHLQKNASKILDPELRDFLKERDRRKDGKYNSSRINGNPNLEAYISYLNTESEKILNIDLTDTFEQLRFPNLIRILLLKEIDKTIDIETARNEWRNLIEVLRKFAKTNEEKTFLNEMELFGRENSFIKTASGSAELFQDVNPALYPRKLFEYLHLFTKNHDIDPSVFGEFIKSFQILVFQAEIQAEDLMKEMALLEGWIIETLAKSEKEKNFIK